MGQYMYMMITFTCTLSILRWMKSWGMRMASEGSERRVGKEIVQDKVQGEAVPFSFPAKSGEELRASALVFVECLIDHVFYLLDENKM